MAAAPTHPTHLLESLLAAALTSYQLIGTLERGGQGCVFRAVQTHTRRDVAIKVLREGLLASPSDRARFEREIRILATLRHPNIVTIHDSGVMPDGHLYFVMDYIAGKPLDEWIQGSGNREQGSAPAPGSRFPVPVLRLFATICDAVHAAHLRGIIHRDLKPSNILIDAQGEPHVLDFGLAKLAADDESGAGAMTLTGQFIGSPRWASPEQAAGRPDDVDVRSDVYALGVIFYHALTGRFPYEVSGDMPRMLDSIIRSEPIRPRSAAAHLNDEIEAILLKCLRKEPERRYQSAAELGNDLRHYLAGEPIEAKRDSRWYVLNKTLRRYRVAVATVALVTVLVTGSAIALAVMYARQGRLLNQVAQQSHRISDEVSKVTALNDFLRGALTSPDPQVDGSDARMVDVLDRAVASLDVTFSNQPAARAEILALRPA